MKPDDKSFKHRELFTSGVNALRGYGVAGDLYRCPICCDDFDERAIFKGAPDTYCLTLEHAPPESIGGKVVALTCKKCNNDLGSRLDSQVAAREQFFRFVDPNRPDPKPFPGTLTLSQDPEVKTNIRISGKLGSGINVSAGKRHNHPENLSEARNSLEGISLSGGRFHGSLGLPAYDEKCADLGFLKSAFLCLFAKFGYTFALSAVGRFVSNAFLCESDFKVVKLNPFPGYENSILVGEVSGVCFVGFGEFLVVCPWLNASIEKFSEACKAPDSFLGQYKLIPFDLPFGLEAILDNSSRR